MPVAYQYDPNNYKFIGEITRQLDPVASEQAGEDIYLVPGNATVMEPLPTKDGFDVIWNPEQEQWEYKEIEKSAEPEPYIPTELDKAYDAMYDAKMYLANTDYINDKINDALNTGDEDLAAELRTKYADTFAERAMKREEVRHWEAEIDRLTTETTLA